MDMSVSTCVYIPGQKKPTIRNAHYSAPVLEAAVPTNHTVLREGVNDRGVTGTVGIGGQQE